MNIEKWIAAKIAEDIEFREATRGQPPRRLTRRDIERYQLFKINKMIRYVSEMSPFHRGLAERVGRLKTLEDLRKIPFTTAADLSQDPYRLLCVSLTGVVRIFSHFTTGTVTRRPKKIFFTQADIGRIVESMSVVLQTVFESAELEAAGCKVQIFLPNNGEPLSMAQMIAEGVRRLGGTPVIGLCEASTIEQIESVIMTKPDMLMGSAFRLWRITQVGRELRDLSAAGVKIIFVTSEYLSTAMRKRIEDIWNAAVYHHYGMTEPGFVVGVECCQHDGFHFNECDLYFEVVDPETGDVLMNGEEGELVFTSLEREGMPFIRYRTGDIASLTGATCGCGASSLFRIGTLSKKLGMIHSIGHGGTVYSSLFDEALYDIPELIDYRIYLSRRCGIDSLTCKVETLHQDPWLLLEIERCLSEVGPIKRALDEGILFRPVVEIAARESLRRGGRSLKRKIVDERAREEISH